MPSAKVYATNKEHYREYNREYLREYRLTHPQKQYPHKCKDWWKKYRLDNQAYSAYQIAYRNRTKENRKKYLARQEVNRAIRKGIIERKSCEVSDCLNKPEAHHEDYGKPLDIKWLCKNHHEQYHHLLK